MQEITINQNEALPLHEQLTQQLKYRIEIGAWRPGKRLPTVRELATILHVNYHTVRVAYQELERDGYVVTAPGRGTFVSDHPPFIPVGQTDSLLDLIDEALIKAETLGVPADVFVRTAYARAQSFTRPTGDIHLLFSECNKPDLEYHARTIQQHAGILPQMFLLDELHEHVSAFFAQFDLIVTTFTHVAELQELVGRERKVLGLMVEPSYMEVLAELAPLPASTPVGLICATQKHARNMERILLGTGILHLRYLPVGVDQPEELKQIFERSDHLYVSRLGLSVHQGHWPTDKPVHEYITHLDAAALRLLRREIAHIRVAHSIQ